MKNEKEKNNTCKIFCIYFNGYGKKGGDLLEKIAKIGETNKYYNSNSLDSLYQAFDKISEAIQTNYKLKLEK